MPGSDTIATNIEGLRKLRAYIAKSTRFVMGVTEFDGVEWLLIRALTNRVPASVPEEELSRHRWSGMIVHQKAWLFLHIEIGERRDAEYSFAFDCNNGKSSGFLRELLRNRRLAIGFSKGKAFRLDPSPATSLVEDLGQVLNMYLLGWQKEYRLTRS